MSSQQTLRELKEMISELSDAEQDQPAVVFLPSVGTHVFVQGVGRAEEVDQQGDLGGVVTDDAYIITAR